MENGSSGDDVVQLQRSLAECNSISVGRWGADGEYGGDTVSAVRTFQKGHNLSPDGIYGPATRSAMLWNVYDYVGNWTGCRHL
ncbi:peptidoglycan-binding protein [Kitasatospora sp. NPDC059827]|uniref:peptidoglycan-binding domain-containing protein n=1 Tax=Kitasatospora sp. NPDC059827 TaxID=3346964 RepID=UPI00364ED677